jgi:hypothetical protein
MRELRFDGLSPDGDRLVLAGKDGQKYTVVIDERIEAAVRRDRARISQVEIEQSGMLRPREIQARIRAGATAEDVAAASGLPIEHIRRFEGPVLTERAWVAQQAQATEVRRPGGDIELGDLVAERLHSLGVDPADIAWDAWRRDDGLWVVIATFPVPPNTHVATWTYDSGSRTMTVADDNARTLSAITADGPLHLAPARPALASVAPLVADEDEEAARPVAIVTSMSGRATDRRTEEAGAAEDLGVDAEDLGVDAEDLGVDAEAESIESELAEEPLADAPGLRDPEEPDFPVDEGLEPEGSGDADDSQDEDDEDEDEGQDADADEEDEEDEDVLRAGPTSDAEDVPLFEAPAPPPHRPTGKPAVPSFDDILFGPGPAK